MTKPDPVIKAIDNTHADLIRAAKQIYEERMKPARKRLTMARAAVVRAEHAIRDAEIEHRAELTANLAEVQLWREEERRAVFGVRPARLSDIEGKTHITMREGAPVSLRRVRILDHAGERAA